MESQFGFSLLCLAEPMSASECWSVFNTRYISMHLFCVHADRIGPDPSL